MNMNYRDYKLIKSFLIDHNRHLLNSSEYWEKAIEDGRLEKDRYVALIDSHYRKSEIINRLIEKYFSFSEDEVKLINYIMSKLSIDVVYNYKQWIGRYEHIICE